MISFIPIDIGEMPCNFETLEYLAGLTILTIGEHCCIDFNELSCWARSFQVETFILAVKTSVLTSLPSVGPILDHFWLSPTLNFFFLFYVLEFFKILCNVDSFQIIYFLNNTFSVLFNSSVQFSDILAS